MSASPAPEEHRLALPDGTHLHLDRYAGRQAAAASGAASVVFLHGFATYGGPYRPVAEAFARAGMDVTVVDVRGHGRSEGRRGYVRRFSDFVNDLDVVLEWTRGRALTPDAPVVVAGHSHGGTIALAHALTGRLKPAALALGAPWLATAMKVPVIKRAASPVLGVLWPTLALANGIRMEDVSRDGEVQARLAADPLIHHVATARWFNEALAAQAHILAQAGSWSIPTFIQVPEADRIASPDVTTSFVRAAIAAGRPVEAKTYPGVFHELFLEPERDRAIADLVGWVSEQLTSGVVARDKARILSSS